MRPFTFAAVLATVFIGLSQAPSQAQDTIRIGVLEPMTGPANKNGIENFTAMEIARDMINERGGINGKKVEFLLADVPNPTAAVSETERLITKDGVKITLGSESHRWPLRSVRPRSGTVSFTGKLLARRTSLQSAASNIPSRLGLPAIDMRKRPWI